MLEEGIGARWKGAGEPSIVEFRVMLDVVVIRLAAPKDTTIDVLALGEIGEKAGGNPYGVSECLVSSKLSEKEPCCWAEVI